MNRIVARYGLRLLATAIAICAVGTAQARCQASAKIDQQGERVNTATQKGPFKADWDSLGAYPGPLWFRGAKLGIFIPWGVYSVPAFGNEWYSRNIYVEGTPAFKHHIETYGPQSKFGYKDFIPMFKAEHFNAEAWVDLFQQAGAKYIV